MNTLESTISMLEVMPEEARILVLQYTQSLFNARKSVSPYIKKSSEQILEELEESRKEIEDGKGMDMKSALKRMGEDHAFL